MNSQLVDLHGRPVTEDERVNHNERVALGAHYSPLLNLAEMTTRYRMVGTKRVQDIETGQTYSWSAFVAIYAASITKVDGKNIPVTTLFLQAQPTFETLAAMEPELIALMNRAKASRGTCANVTWYGSGGLRTAMSKLVGWQRRQGPSALQESAAYDLVYRALWNALPDCSGCGCLSL